MKMAFISRSGICILTKRLLVCAFMALAFCCTRRESTIITITKEDPKKEDPKKSAENSITGFTFTKADNTALSADVSGTINETDKTITAQLPTGTVVTALIPAMSFSGKTVSPASGAAQDFTNPVTYTVTAEDGATKAYTVSVSVSVNNNTSTPPETNTGNAFVSTWAVVAGDLSVTLPLVDDGNYNFVVDWGDGTDKKNVTTKAEGKHIYNAAGIYTINITGTIEGFAFGNGYNVGNVSTIKFNLNPEAKKIRTISSWGPLKLGATNGQFAGAENLVITATDSSGLLSQTTDLSMAFYVATNFDSDISGWDVSNIKNMSGMFYRAGAFNQNRRMGCRQGRGYEQYVFYGQSL